MIRAALRALLRWGTDPIPTQPQPAARPCLGHDGRHCARCRDDLGQALGYVVVGSTVRDWLLRVHVIEAFENRRDLSIHDRHVAAEERAIAWGEVFERSGRRDLTALHEAVRAYMDAEEPGEALFLLRTHSAVAEVHTFALLGEAGAEVLTRREAERLLAHRTHAEGVLREMEQEGWMGLYVDDDP